MKKDSDEEAETAFSNVSRVLALKELKGIIRRNDTNVAAHFYVSLLYLRLGKFDSAFKHAQLVLALSPEEPNIFLNMGCIHEKRGAIDKAITFYKRELSRNSRSTESLINLGMIYFDRSDWEKTADCLARYRKEGGPVDVDIRLARAYYELGAIDKESGVYKSRLQRDPKDSWALQNLGAAMLDLDDKNKATAYLKRARVLDPKNQMIKRNLAKAGAL